MYRMAVRDTAKGTVVAAADAAIIDETFGDGDVTLHVDPAFYDDGEAGIDDIAAALDRCRTANLVGNDLIAALIDRGAVAADETRTVGDVQHAQLFRL